MAKHRRCKTLLVIRVEVLVGYLAQTCIDEKCWCESCRVRRLTEIRVFDSRLDLRPCASMYVFTACFVDILQHTGLSRVAGHEMPSPAHPNCSGVTRFCPKYTSETMSEQSQANAKKDALHVLV